jgi:hypothetical protein
MKKFATIFAILALVAVSGGWACDKDKALNAAAEKGSGEVREVALTGFLTDSYCGAANASAKGKSCTLECIKKGAKVQLYAQETLYTLDQIASVEKYVGVQVKVTGMLDESTSTIKVKSIEEVKS